MVSTPAPGLNLNPKTSHHECSLSWLFSVSLRKFRGSTLH